MVDVLNQIDSFVWGPPLLVLLIGTGIMLTIRLRLLLHDCARCIRQQHSHRHDDSGTARISPHICPGSAAAADRAQAGVSTNARPLVRTFAAALPTQLHGSKIAHTTAQNTRMTHT